MSDVKHPYIVTGKHYHYQMIDGQESLTVIISVVDAETGERVDYVIPGVLVAAFEAQLALARKDYPDLTGNVGELTKKTSYTVPLMTGKDKVN